MKKLNHARIQGYKVALEKAYAYYLDHQREDGSFLPKEESLCQPYNCYALLSLAGASTAAKKYHDWLASCMLDRRDGLQYVPQDTVWATHTTYFKGWVAYGAHLFGFYDQSLRAVGGLERYIDHETGGVYVTEKGAERRTVTSFFRGAPTAMAMLATGRLGQAHKIGESMLRTIFEQPDPENQFYGYQDGKTGRVVTSAELYSPPIFGFEDWKDASHPVYDEHEMDAYCFLIDANKDNQSWALFGPPLAFLLGMYELTADRRYLDGSMQIFELFWKSRPHNSTRFISSCKILQGLPQMYLATGDERVLTGVTELADYLTEMQQPEGFWVKETLTGLNRPAAIEEQGEWLRLVQIGDCGLSLANVQKYLG